MRILTIIISLFLLTAFEAKAQTEIELDASQSMIMTGKGSGQDATINPYYGEDCMAIVENIGEREISIRIQQDGEVINEIPLPKGEEVKVKILKDQELYLDPNPNGRAKARVSYEKLK